MKRRPLRTVTAPRSHYDVCLLVAMAPYWVPSLRYVRDLRRSAKRIVVYLFDSRVSVASGRTGDRSAPRTLYLGQGRGASVVGAMIDSGRLVRA
jgi:hypothetical protein